MSHPQNPQVPPYSPHSYPGYTPPPVPPQKKRAWPWIVGAVVALLVIIGACAPAKTATSSTPYSGASGSAVTAAAAPAAPAKPSGPATTFTDGTWVVGEDIVAGTYKSDGAEPGLFEFCSVSTYATDTGDGNVLSWDTANAGEPMRVKVSGKVKSVKASGCTPFTKVA